MPKIFLIKNRLHQAQQQLRLQEANRIGHSDSSNDLLDVDSQQPLPLIVFKKQQEARSLADLASRKPPEQRLLDKPTPASNEKPKTDPTPPVRRFFSSILGGDIPYGSSRTNNVLTTRVERKECVSPPSSSKPVLEPKKEVLPETSKPTQNVPKAPVRHFSVIQRAPNTKRDDDIAARLPNLIIQEPEQEQPIDYHIPKRRGDCEDEREERRRTQTSTSGRPVISKRVVPSQQAPKSITCAAGHGRNTSSNTSNTNQNSTSNSSGSGSISFSSLTSAGSGGGGGGGMSSGGTGGGGGRDNRQNYGPSSPPTGSLPPFYESLKGGNNGNQNNNNNHNNYNQNGNHNYMNGTNTNYHVMHGGGTMDCEPGQELANLSLNGTTTSNNNNHNDHNPPKQYSTLQNASYGIILKDESDLDIYTDPKIEPMNLPYGAPPGYPDDTMMVDMVTGAVVDPLQFTATLAFSSSAEHALLESLTEAADLSTFLQRLPNDDTDNGDELDNGSGGGNHSQHQVDQIDSSNFHDQIVLANGRNGTTATNNGYIDRNSYVQFQNKLNSYSEYVNVSESSSTTLHIQQTNAQQPQQILSPGLSSFNSSPLDLDSPTTMSLPSPGAASCSLDDGVGTNAGSLSPSANVSGRRISSCSDTASLHGRLGLPTEMQLEFVNGGHGIKNPLANQETVRQGPRTEDKAKIASITTEDGQTNFCCRICNKTFGLQRLLNRHMKCHSDVKRYLCTFCGKGFNDTFDLKRHTRTHTGVRPYKCSLCEKSFTQRCSLESHCLKVHGVQHQYAYKERRTKVYVCEECGHTTSEPEVHYLHLKEKHPYSPALLKFYDKRHFKFTNSNFANMLLQDTES